MTYNYVQHFWQRFSPLSENMNISKGHSGLLKIFLLNLVKFHLVLGFQQSPFQISLEFKHDGMMNKQSQARAELGL